MKIKDIFSIKNINSFIEGNYNYFKHKLGNQPGYIEEQVLWRLKQCQDDCVPKGKCIECGCPTHKKVFVTSSCNNGKRFPDLMGEKEWTKFKKENNIDEEQL